MTIKQTGGIFGRNPSFNDITMSNLEVDAGSATGTHLLITTTGSGHNIDMTASGGTSRFRNASGNLRLTADLNNATADSRIQFDVDGSEKARIDSSGNFVFKNSGQGIDFSATSGTGTSELFSDYEEGSWSPVLSTGMSSGPSGYTTQRGSYTKVGNLVSAQLEMDANGAVGSAALITLSGLPFTSSANSLAHGGGFFTYSNSFSTGSNVTIHIPASDTKIAFYRNNGNQVLGNDSDVSINNLVMLTVVYVAA